jgi:hypothetical protein
MANSPCEVLRMVVLKKISEDSRSWDWHDDRFWQDSQLAMASSGRPTTADETRLESPKFSENFSCVQPLIYIGMDPGWVKPGPPPSSRPKFLSDA